MRQALFLLTLLAGIALGVAGFLLSAPLGATTGPETSDPRMAFAPGVFVIGVLLVFGSAVVYELVPDRSGE